MWWCPLARSINKICCLGDIWRTAAGIENIRVTTISPGVVEQNSALISRMVSKDALKEFRKTALTPDVIARAVLYAVSQPDDVDVNEIIVRPTTSAF